MRKLLPALLPLILWLGVACGSGSGNNPQASALTTPTAQAAAAATATPAACPAPAAAAFATPAVAPDDAYLGNSIQAAIRLLQKWYIQPISSTQPLLEAAWTGARDKLKLTDAVPDAARRRPGRPIHDALQRAQGRATFQELTDAALTAMAATFKDKHTTYLPSAFWASERRGGTNSFGFVSQRLGDASVITIVYPGSAADAAGLRRGDVVSSVDGKPPSQITGSDFTRLSDGHSFPVVYTREGGPPTTIQIQIKPISLVQTTDELLPDNIGYLRLYSFPRYQVCNSEGMFREIVDRAVVDLKAKGARTWILDLRGNSGGALEGAAYLSGLFGLDGRLATLRYKDGSVNRVDSSSQSAIGTAPLAILIDEQSQSASEITAFALHDRLQAPLIGAHTAGNVQAAGAFPVGGGALQITYAKVGVGTFEESVDSGGVLPTIPVTLDRDLLAREGRDTQIEAAVAYLKAHLR